MPSVRAPHQFGQITDQDEFNRSLSRYMDELHPVVNGKLEFDKNINSQTVPYYFIAANTNYVLSHNLNKTGVHFLIGSKSKSCDIFHGSGTDTTTTVNLSSSVAGVSVMLILA